MYEIMVGCFRFAAYNIVKNKFGTGMVCMFHFLIMNWFQIYLISEEIFQYRQTQG